MTANARWGRARRRPGARRRGRSGRRLSSVAVGAGVAGGVALLAACSGGSEDPLEKLADEAAPADWSLRPGVEMVTVEGVAPGESLTLYDEAGEAVVAVAADDEGRAHFAYVPEGSPDGPVDVVPAGDDPLMGEPVAPGDYLIRAEDADPVAVSERFTVPARDDVPEPGFYDGRELAGADMDVLGQPVDGAEPEDGFQYIEMRDGVLLSAMVRFPDRGLYGDGPWPTVIELSGYGPSNPAAEEPGSQLARTLGYATVSVNLRGTGCSGGVFDTFNPAQMADGYDVVEVVARQPWVLHNRVGMVGLSYSGITQLYTAATRPPSLAAITPQSVIADPWLQQWPGGIYNAGFTREWLEEQSRQSAPGGAGWVEERITAGDDICEANVGDHGLNVDFAAMGRSLEMRPTAADDRDLRELVGDIDVPVFLTGAFHDEQTGAQFGSLLDRFDDAPVLRASLWNGRHPDGYSVMNLVDLFEFLELYVAERSPQLPAGLEGALAAEVSRSFDFERGELAPVRLAEEFGDDHAAALASYEAEDPILVRFGNGLGTFELGAPGAPAELRLPAWPSPDAVVTEWHLTGDGGLASDGAPVDEAEAEFRFDPEAAGVDVFPDGYRMLGGVWDFDWTRFPEGAALSYETEPFDDQVVVAGPGYAELWVGADAPDADVQVTVTELRADGVEHLVQSGRLRLGHRAEDESRSTDLDIVHHFTAEAYQPLPDGEMVRARVPLPAMGHVFAEGSLLRVTVSSPGRDHALWLFEPVDGVDEDTTYRVGTGGGTPSHVVLPVLDTVVEGYPDELPCPGLRGVPCRAEP